jgi:hypothetical protein
MVAVSLLGTLLPTIFLSIFVNRLLLEAAQLENNVEEMSKAKDLFAK